LKSKNGFEFVLDCSVTMSWLFEDEVTTQTEKILEHLESSQVVVPSIWPLEVANVLLIAKRKKRVTDLQVSGFIDALATMPIHVDDSTTSRAMHSIFTLASQENLTIYDAAYLELAIRENIPIATLDNDLLKVSKRLKINIFRKE